MIKVICDRCKAAIENPDGAIKIAVYKNINFKCDGEEKRERIDLCPSCAEAFKYWFASRPLHDRIEGLRDAASARAWRRRAHDAQRADDLPRVGRVLRRHGELDSDALPQSRDLPRHGAEEAGARQPRAQDEALVYQLTNGEFRTLCEAVKAHKKRTGKPAGHEEEA